MYRRDMLKAAGLAALTPTLAPTLAQPSKVKEEAQKVIKQSASLWCWKMRNVSLPDLCKAARDNGMTALDLLSVEEWAVASSYGLTCSVGMIGAGTIGDGLNDKANHSTIIKAFETNIPLAAKNKVPNVIVFFGDKRGKSDAEAIENSIACLNKAKKIAEDNNVTIVIELLNSKVDHKDYQGDRTSYGVEIIKAVGSPNVKLLYDIYHMQIMEGDVIRTIRNNHQYIGHYHTGGVPGRNEIDDTQELYYPAICKAIIETGFTGYLAHEFIPKRDPLTSLREALKLCDV
jgi:hydroxypyruvate isomerase